MRQHKSAKTRKMPGTNIRISEELAEKMRTIAETSKRSLTKQVELALEYWLEETRDAIGA